MTSPIFEIGKEYNVVMIEEDIEGPAEVQRFHCEVKLIAWPVIRFGWVTGEYIIINVSSPHFVRAVPCDRVESEIEGV